MVWPTPAETTVLTSGATQPGATGSTSPSTRPDIPAWDNHVAWFGFQTTISPELRLLLIVIITAALGSYIHATTSFTSYVGNRTLRLSWMWWYILRGPIGVALAIIFYCVVRGGLFSSSAVAKDMSPFGVAALSGLVGMFSKQATDKLRETADNLFRTAPGKGDDARSNKLQPPEIVITGIVPSTVDQRAKDVRISVQGKNFTQGATVLVNELQRNTEFLSDTELIVYLDETDTASSGSLTFIVQGAPPSDRQSNAAILTVREAS